MSAPTVAVIPARGGSSRIPRKNLAPLGGCPLVAHTIQAALRSCELDRVFVSTQDTEIGAVSRQHGAEVIWRPQQLSTDTAATEPALIHAVEVIEGRLGQRVGAVVMLQPTSPLRGTRRVDQAVRLLRDRGCDAVVSVTRDVGHYFLGDVDQQGWLQPGYDPGQRLRTQDIPPRYRENGAIYVMTRQQIMERGCRMGGRMQALVMEQWESIDIDTLLDLELARVLVEQRDAVVLGATTEAPGGDHQPFGDSATPRTNTLDLAPQ